MRTSPGSPTGGGLEADFAPSGQPVPAPRQSFLARALAAVLGRMGGHEGRTAESQLKTYRHIIETVRDAVLRFAPDGSLVFATKSVEPLLGCFRYELSGTALRDRIHLLDRPMFMAAYAEAAQDGRDRTVEVRIRRDDRTTPAAVPVFIWVEMVLTPIRDGQAGPQEVVALLRDISERREDEQRMLEARRAAEEASSAKSRFLATIGHELRTPLNAIVGFSEMMTSGVVGDLSPAHREYAQIIHQSGHHLLDVVTMLLDMSRIEAGKFELQTEPFEPEALLDPCLKMVDALARKRRVAVDREVALRLPMLVADERACRQILINLLSNAVKFSQEGGRVTVSMKRQGTMLNIAVTDHGIGMDERALNRIGEPFFQVQDDLARGYEGTGLGLSIVHGLVELHGGTLKAQSEPGRGTTMTVLLPLNGPVTKTHQTVLPLKREPAAAEQFPEWHEEKRHAK